MAGAGTDGGGRHGGHRGQRPPHPHPAGGEGRGGVGWARGGMGTGGGRARRRAGRGGGGGPVASRKGEGRGGGAGGTVGPRPARPCRLPRHPRRPPRARARARRRHARRRRAAAGLHGRLRATHGRAEPFASALPMRKPWRWSIGGMRGKACACHARHVACARSRPLYLSPVPCAADVADAIPMLQHRPCCRACLKIMSAFDFPASVKSASDRCRIV